MRFGGVLGSIDNIALDNPKRDIYELGIEELVSG